MPADRATARRFWGCPGARSCAPEVEATAVRFGGRRYRPKGPRDREIRHRRRSIATSGGTSPALRATRGSARRGSRRTGCLRARARRDKPAKIPCEALGRAVGLQRLQRGRRRASGSSRVRDTGSRTEITTRPPKLCPIRSNGDMSSRSSCALRSSAIACAVYPVGGIELRPWPRRSTSSTRFARARLGATSSTRRRRSPAIRARARHWRGAQRTVSVPAASSANARREVPRSACVIP